jgi:NTP pyrophosphatase (non-canonical NTP hydrolase)
MIINDETKKFLSEGLEVLASTQEATSRLVPGASSEYGVTDAMLSLVCFCLIDEIGELAKELGYKPWKPIMVDNEKVADEFADVLAFFGLMTHYILEVTGLTPEDLADAYREKTVRNIERFTGASELDSDYGGVSDDLDYASELLRRITNG